MGTNLNFNNLGNDIPVEGDGGGTFNFPLARQSSVYSLTFDEFQNTVGGIGKDFGSMNMDELLKNIWTAEENQNIGSAIVGGNGQESDSSLPRQGSLIIPRTLSLKTVEEVWRDISEEYVGTSVNGGMADDIVMSERQPTLGEITLEDFLMKAGIVREEPRLGGNSNDVFYNNLTTPTNSLELGFGNQNNNGNLPLSVNGSRTPAYQQQPLQTQLLPNHSSLAYSSTMVTPSNGQLSNPIMTSGIAGITDPTVNNTMVQNIDLQGGGLGMLGLRTNGFNVETGSPVVSSDVLTRNNIYVSSVSPVPCAFNGVLRGRKIAAVEKVVERRHRRMIKNRESAARSRARKQAYTMELEAEVAKLKEENQVLQKKHAEMEEIQRKQAEMMKCRKNASEKPVLRRTHTGPW